jgi:hypothetical protein
MFLLYRENCDIYSSASKNDISETSGLQSLFLFLNKFSHVYPLADVHSSIAKPSKQVFPCRMQACLLLCAHVPQAQDSFTAGPTPVCCVLIMNEQALQQSAWSYSHR